jgi:hypothetical protein
MARFDRRLVDRLRSKGLRVREVSGWQTRGKSGLYPKGIIAHATAGSRTSTTEGELRVLLNGSSTAPPPIAQFLLARDGEVLVVASGLCYHVGSGWLGNDELIGIEAVNANDGEPYPAVQYEAYVTLVAAICEHYGWPANQVKGHYEVSSTGKTDPRFVPSRVKVGMDDFRARVAARLSGVDVDEGDDELNSDQARKLDETHAAVLKVLRGDVTEDNANIYWARRTVDGEDAAVNGTWKVGPGVGIKQLADRLDALAAKVDAISVGGVDVAAIAKAVADEQAKRMES